jgi:hypothetical protein
LSIHGEFDLPCKAAFRQVYVGVVALVSWVSRFVSVVVFGWFGLVVEI